MLEKLGSNPSASIPVACGGYREIKAAYRLLSNEKVDAQKILEPHYASTEERMRKQSIVLCIQDTTELDIYDIFFEREEFLQRGELAADWLVRFRDDRNTTDDLSPADFPSNRNPVLPSRLERLMTLAPNIF